MEGVSTRNGTCNNCWSSWQATTGGNDWLTFIFSLVQAKNKQKNSFFLVHPAWKWRMSPLWRHPLLVNLRLLETFRESSFTLWAQTPADTIALKFRSPAKQFLIVSLADAAESRMESCTIKIILLLKKGGEIKLFFFKIKLLKYPTFNF